MHLFGAGIITSAKTPDLMARHSTPQDPNCVPTVSSLDSSLNLKMHADLPSTYENLSNSAASFGEQSTNPIWHLGCPGILSEQVVAFDFHRKAIANSCQIMLNSILPHIVHNSWKGDYDS